MKRKTGLVGLVLTMSEDNKSLTDEEAKNQCKRMLTALKDIAKRKDWSYVIWVYFSRSEADKEPEIQRFIVHKKQVKRPHFHVILYANPCRTVAEWVNNYWNTQKTSKRRKWGKVHRHDIYDYYGYTGYCSRQKAFKERRQEYKGAVDLEMGKICEYEKRQ